MFGELQKSWLLMAKLKNIQKQVEELADYIFLSLPPCKEDTQKQWKKIMEHRRQMIRPYVKKVIPPK